MAVDDRAAGYLPETRVVAFLDILGFRELTARRIADAQFLNRLDRVLMFAEGMLNGRISVSKRATARMFSDCICASCPLTGRDLVDFIYTLESLQLRLAQRHVFIRGAVCIGQHFETPRMLVSLPLIEAYDHERLTAVYPRIVITDSVIEALRTMTAGIKEEAWSSFLGVTHSIDRHIVHDDGESIYYLNYLADWHAYDMTGSQIDAIQLHKEGVEDWVRDGIRSGAPESVRKKYLWLIRYHNRALRQMFPSIPADDEDLIDEALLAEAEA